MCKECTWGNKDKDPLLHKECDCGHSSWQESFRQPTPHLFTIYRCDFCDALYQTMSLTKQNESAKALS